MSREEPQINIRVSNELKEKIRLRAKNNRRSMNAEIVQILLDAVSDEVSSKEEFATREAETFKQALLETLNKMYNKEEK
ncbi:Arc family DNA-binding protein [Salmonella enterica subsp. enterica]|uniref:Arc family DNA-binding protein n=1 Tax=Salmonella enterica TaxID=28901 RepID=UPI00126C9EDA|nr:Arc family DNA-binding protein [Salmonella enterica subsp. houtenae serovar 48:g,z51:-]EBG3700929.1 Arc family DNA-binding protein [Salmonella enterica]ECF6955397.1 Arc family DNA-binding protein [Salmonella enterica subsp. enterica]EAV6817445.1 Arc family DNA-binding protein [Salmonella enterica subsp. houtenae serovar 48:g,z51:-]EBG4345975.1 Arc family DNA-binding protein [Salmonella enterica]